MARRLTVRVLLGGVTVLGVVVLTFALQFLVPGDPARTIAGPRASPEVLAQIRENLELDDSVAAQLRAYVGNVVRGDLGTSYVRGRPVLDLIAERLPATAVLAAAAIAFELVVGGALGLWDGLRRRRSAVLALANTVLLSIPVFALGFGLLLVFAYELALLPVTGGTGPLELVLPAVTLGLIGVPYYSNVVRDQVQEAVAAPYTRTAVAKGLPRALVLRRHVARNAASPVLTMAGLDFAVFLSGVVFVEAIFAWPGIGQLQTQAFADVDRPLLMGTVIVAAVLVVTFNLAVDLLRVAVDPRTRADAT